MWRRDGGVTALCDSCANYSKMNGLRGISSSSGGSGGAGGGMGGGGSRRGDGSSRRVSTNVSAFVTLQCS